MLETLWSQRDSNVFKIAVLTVAEQRWRKTSHFIIYESSILHTKKFMDSAKNCNNLRLFVSTFFLSFQQKFENTADYLTISANGIATKHTKA